MEASFVFPSTPLGAERVPPHPPESSTLLTVRERWFGATGKRVPAIALEGTIDLDGALVVDSVDDGEALRAAHSVGQPVVARARDAVGVTAALARPEVSCVLVTDPALLELDLPELTYG
jgi:hypothetical protein